MVCGMNVTVVLKVIHWHPDSEVFCIFKTKWELNLSGSRDREEEKQHKIKDKEMNLIFRTKNSFQKL